MLGIHFPFIVRNRHFFISDLAIFVASAVASYVIRLERFDLGFIIWGIVLFLLISIPLKLFTFLLVGIYHRYWKNAGPNELLLVTFCGAGGGGLTIAAVLTLSESWPNSQFLIPRSVPFIDLLIGTALLVASRFSLRMYHFARLRVHQRLGTPEHRALIIGAGRTGIRVLETLENATELSRAVGFLDDDKGKVGAVVHGLKVLGLVGDLQVIARKTDANLVVIAIPSARSKLIRQILQDCQELGIEHRIMPSMAELLSGKTSVNTLRSISIDDLLRRAPITLDTGDIQQRLVGRCVLITGAGGSIGAELGRQIARHRPGRLLLLGHGENSLFDVGNRLKSEFPALSCEILLIDIRDLEGMEAAFQKYKPEVVFHAAAHKHVPMLESNVLEAIRNNVIGTCNIIDLCKRYNVERMISISTDKAVMPTSVMGMTKRLAELAIMNAAQEYPTRFAAVRFGNVLGSRGSVVPLFQRQIADGGPVTITSSDMTRFFMSIPEAVLLVLKASVLKQYGPLFVLNMGEPVRIIDLAHDLIRLSGLEPGRDVEVKVSGIRPGEKLYEELFWSYENYHPVETGTIFALELHKEQANFITTDIPNRLQTLIQIVERRDEKAARSLLEQIVTTPFPDALSAATGTPASRPSALGGTAVSPSVSPAAPITGSD